MRNRADLDTFLCVHVGAPQINLPLDGRACLQVVEETISDDDVLMIRGCQATTATTVLLRGANDYMLDEMDRSLHDAFCIVKRVLESGTVVPGEMAQSTCTHACPNLCPSMHLFGTLLRRNPPIEP